MKIALVHDYIKEYGGAERVLEELHSIFPEAPVYTSVYLPEFLGPHRKKFESWNIKTSWANYLPMRHKLISPLRLISPLLFRSFDFSEYDVILTSSTGAYFPNTVCIRDNEQKTMNKKHSKMHAQRLICYCHTPPRYLYGYATAREWRRNKVLNVIGEVMNHFLRQVDFKASKNVDMYIANSEEVRSRIQKFYRKDAVVIYPPIVTKNQELRNQNKRTYYLTGGRLARAKHNEIPVKACLELGLPLKVFGKGFAGYESELRSLTENYELRTKNQVEFLGEVSDEEKLELMSGARAFLYASEDEDFGIIPVEAMSVGTPIIAYRSGGVTETVKEGESGLFYEELSVEAMKTSIKKFQKMMLKEEDCITQAKKFSSEEFAKRIRQIVHKNTLP